jgi:hypothetical protein
MKIYYSHCQAIYDSPQEARDIEILERFGFVVINPNSPEHIVEAQRLKSEGKNAMPYFEGLVTSCDALAFRAMPDSSIPAGIAKEIRTAAEINLPVIELPSQVLRRVLSVEQTREYLTEIGQR